jgi:hypothetical protein
MLRLSRFSSLLALIVLLAGCGGTQRVQDGDAPDAFTRAVAPFEVLDTSGEPYAHPFLGGVNVPRPQFVDVDGDGDTDLFVQEQTGRIMFFERVSADEAGAGGGSSEAPDGGSRLVWRTDDYQGLDVGEWFRFADLDGDGDPDLLAEQPYSYIRVYRNEGTAGAPRFVQVVDTLRAADGTPIFSDRQNIPTVTDVDCNGRLDLFLGRLDGTVDRYEALQPPKPGTTPSFELVQKRFEDIEIVNQIGSLHGANTLAFADPDRDGDLDLFWGDFFEPGLLLIENRGEACERVDLRTRPEPFPPSNPISTSGYNAPTLADVTGNGRLDLLVGVLGGAYDATTTLADNLYFYEHGPGGYTLQTKQYLDAIDAGNESHVAAGDIDGDGDLDLLLSNKIEPSTGRSSRLRLFENTGTDGAPTLHHRGTLDLSGAYHYAPALGDLDDDGDPDLLVGTWKGRLTYAPNDGGAFSVASDVLVEISGSNPVPTLGDLDDDGDLDLLVGEGSGTILFYRNEGTPSSPEFVLVDETLAGLDRGARSTPHLTDLDGDGDLDLLVGSRDQGIAVVRNTGTPADPAFTLDGTLPVDAPTLSDPTFVDLYGTGRPLLLSGTAGGGIMLWRPSGGTGARSE